MPSIAIASSVSAPKSSLSQRLHEVGLSQEKLDPWLADLRQSLQQIRETPSQGAGFIEETLLQEVSALLVSKMPAEQAEEISQRVCGIRLNDASLARDARRQGGRAIEIPPLLQQVRSDQTPAVITELKELAIPARPTGQRFKKLSPHASRLLKTIARLRNVEAGLDPPATLHDPCGVKPVVGRGSGGAH